MTDYIRAVGRCYPESSAYILGNADPTVYANLIWVTTPISQALLDACPPPAEESLVFMDGTPPPPGDGDIMVWNATTELWNHVPHESSIDIQNEGTPLAGGPFNTINFIGTDINANDLGSGVVQVDTVQTGNGIIGLSHQLSFGRSGSIKNKWLQTYDVRYSNETTGVMPFKSKLVGISFSNKQSSVNTEIRIYSTPEGGGITPKTLDLSWMIVGKRTAYKTDFTTDVIFDIGDKIGIYAADTAGSDPKDVVVMMYFVAVDDASADGGDSWSGNFATSSGGGSGSS